MANLYYTSITNADKIAGQRKILDAIGWKPQVSAADGVERMVRWVKEMHS